MFELNVSSNMEKKVARFLIIGSIGYHLLLNFVVFADDKPHADKLTISFGASSQRLPPQIAYFVPERLLNKTYNSYGEVIPNNDLWPFSSLNTKLNYKNTKKVNKVIETFTAKPKQTYTYVDTDPETAYQNYNYQIDFGQMPDKEPDFKRFESANGERGAVNKVKSHKYNKGPVSFNYLNTNPDLRSKIKFIKNNHENEFDASKNGQDQSTSASGSGDGSSINSGSAIFSDESNYSAPKPINIFRNGPKSRKSPHKQQNNANKLSQPSSMSISNESGYSFDSIHSNENVNYVARRPPPKSNFTFPSYEMNVKPKFRFNRDHENNNDEDQVKNDYGVQSKNYYGAHRNDEKDTNKPSKGFAIYFTKITQHPLPNRKIFKAKSFQDDFVPSRIMSSVRGVKQVIHKPRNVQQPSLRERIRESGGHIVYTEDGYEDKQYDHGKEDKSVEYLSRTRRSTNVKDLKGQELIDHLDRLIRNVSDYLDSSEIIPDTDKKHLQQPDKKFPLYNNTEKPIEDSPIKYSEYAKPVVDDEYSDELYESKPDNCEEYDEEVDDEIESIPNAHNDTDGRKKRLGNLGNKLECLKKTLFGEEPLDNPLFKEKTISQPKLENLFSSVVQESDNIQTISSVYSDVMDNIKYNSFNENQRIFSDFGVSDNFAVGTINVKKTVKPDNELNTNEKYTDDSKQKSNGKEKQTVTESPLTVFNPFRDPAQLPILDISRYIPTPKYEPTESDYQYQTDFKPIVAPYFSGNNNDQQLHLSTTTIPPPTTLSSPLYGPVRTPAPSVQKSPYHRNGHIPNRNPQNIQNPNVYRNQMQNILLFKRRRPIAMVHVVNNFPGPRS